MKIKNTADTLFRWQEYIWRPGEVIEMGTWAWELRTTHELLEQYKNLVIVDEDDKHAQMIARLEKARATKAANRQKELNAGTTNAT